MNRSLISRRQWVRNFIFFLLAFSVTALTSACVSWKSRSSSPRPNAISLRPYDTAAKSGVKSAGPTSTLLASKKFRVATIQYPIEGGKTFEELTLKMERFISEASTGGAQLVVFPELVLLDLWPLESKQAESEISRKLAVEATPRFYEKAKQWSANFGLPILVGSVPRLVNGQVRNTALFVFPNGTIVEQDKIFLTAWERKMGWQAGDELKVFDAPWGLTAILICYDVEFPMISQALVSSRPAVLLVPSMTESESGLQRVRGSAQARAIEHHAYVVVSSTVGRPTPTWVQHGQSTVLTPRDTAFLAEPVEGERDKPGIVYGDLEIDKLNENRATSDFYPAKDQMKRLNSIPTVQFSTLKIPR